MPVLTWKNVDAPDLSSAARMSELGNNNRNITSGIYALGQAGAQIGGAVKDMINSSDSRIVGQYLAGIANKSPDELKAMQDAGAFSKESMQQQLGTGIDLNKVLPQVEKLKLNSLQNANLNRDYTRNKNIDSGNTAFGEYMSAINAGDTDTANAILEQNKDNQFFTKSLQARNDYNKEFALKEASTRANINASNASAYASSTNAALGQQRLKKLIEEDNILNSISNLSSEPEKTSRPSLVASGNNFVEVRSRPALSDTGSNNSNFNPSDQEKLQLAIMKNDRGAASKLIGKPITPELWQKLSSRLVLPQDKLNDISVKLNNVKSQFDKEKGELSKAKLSELTGNDTVTGAYLDQDNEKYSKIKTNSDLIKFLNDKYKTELGTDGVNSESITRQVNNITNTLTEKGIKLSPSIIAAVADTRLANTDRSTWFNSTKYNTDPVLKDLTLLGSKLQDPAERKRLTTLKDKYDSFNTKLNSFQTTYLKDAQNSTYLNAVRNQPIGMNLSIPSYSNINDFEIQSTLENSRKGLYNTSSQGILRNREYEESKNKPKQNKPSLMENSVTTLFL